MAVPENKQLVWMTEKFVRRKPRGERRTRRVRRALVRWWEDGRVRERTFSDPIEAGRFAAEKREELTGLRAVPVRRELAFSAWCREFLLARFSEYREYAAGKRKRLSDKYLQVYRVAFRRFQEVRGNRLLSDYGPNDFLRFRSTLLEDGALSPVTVENHLTRLRTLFLAAQAEGLLRKAPAIHVRQVYYEKPVLEPREIRRIFAAARKWPEPGRNNADRFGNITGRLYPILATLYFTMMRRGELIHLAWSDVRETRNGEMEIVIQPKDWTDGGKKMRWEPKDREVRAIPVHPLLVPVLEELRANRAHPIWVFANLRGERWTVPGLASLLARFERATGLKAGFHVWGRPGLPHLHDAGVPPGQIQEIAGHSSLSTTMKYVRTSSDGTRKAIRALAI